MENNEPLETILKLNGEIKSKPKPQLTRSFQKQIDVAIAPILSNQESAILDKIVEERKLFAAPLKQGIVEYIRSHPVQETLKPQIVNLLEKFKEDARSVGHIKYLSVLALMQYGQCNDENTAILIEAIGRKKENKKAISQKFFELFERANITQTVEILSLCRGILKLIESEQFDALKKQISDIILDFEPDNPSILSDINRIEELMAQDDWQATPRDELLTSTISGFKEKQNPGLTEADKTKKITLSVVSKKSSTPVQSASNEAGTPRRPENQDLASQRKSEHKPLGFEENGPDNQKPAQDKQRQVGAKKKISKFDGLSAGQEKVVTELIYQFSKLNRNDSENQKKVIILRKKLSALEKRREDLKRTISDCKRDIQQKENLLDELRGRLHSLRGEREKEESRLKNEISRHKATIDEVRAESERLREGLDNIAQELDRERRLSHATHRDAENRAKVVLETKTRSIYRAVSPIFIEVEEFESMADLPLRANMLLNIIHKIKNALTANGIQI